MIGKVGGTLDAERVRYTSYGEPVASPASDLNGDGSVTTSDQTLLLGAFGQIMSGTSTTYIVEADINRDGSITTADLTKLLGQFGNTPRPRYPLRRPQTGSWATTDTFMNRKQASTACATAGTNPTWGGGPPGIRRGMWMVQICISMCCLTR